MSPVNILDKTQMTKPSLKLITPYSEFKKLTRVHSLGHIHKRTKKNLPKAKSRIKELVKQTLENDTTIQSLMSGNLRMEMGIEDAATVTLLINTIVDSISMKYKSLYVVGQKFSNPLIKLSSITGDELSSNSDFNFTSDNDHPIEWLDWLLNRGDEQIVRGFYYRRANRYELRHGYSRAGGIMREAKSGRWGVPSEHSGTKTNNFLTRIQQRITPQIEQVLTDILT